MNKDNLKELYLSSVLLYRHLGKKEDKLILIISVLRLFIFIGGAILIWSAFSLSVFAGLSSALISAILFLYLLILFSAHSSRREFLTNLALINQNEADASSGILAAFDGGNTYQDIKHDFSFDVDLFGESSLFQYLNRTVTHYGRDILADWLSDPFLLSGDLIPRQEAIRELAAKNKWRQEFMAYGMKTPLEKKEISDLLNWLDESPRITSSHIMRLLIYMLPAAALVSLLLLITGQMPYQIFMFVCLGNLIYIVSGIKRTNEIHRSLSGRYSFLSSMNSLLKTFENESFSSPVLNKIKLNISGDKVSASVSVRKLGRLIQSFDSRNNMLAGFLLNGLFLWDYHCIRRLEKWKYDNRKLFPVWLEMVGQVDAFISLGNYAFNNAGFVYPVKTEGLSVFTAKDLGHPLIDEKKRVCNDFSHGKKGTVCIISGANMARKSTFLRTIAINYILGMTGAPVCASGMDFTPCKIFTSMRTLDSLSGNESYFYAELKRLNNLKSKIEQGEPVFFILDEILKGTNSEDKSTGSKLFLSMIIKRGGTGLIATHDTSLGKLEDQYPGTIVNRCFEIEINGENIIFDYKIQDGITQKMNAVFLMKQMGILG
jgi:hypothetical protein